MNEIFKAYDVRGLYPDQMNFEVAFNIGKSLADYLKVSTICVGRDMRVSSPEMSDGLIKGIIEQGVDVVDLGLTSTDMVYFATGKYGYGGGVMITASHNPGEWTGMKICGDNARPISSDNGLFDIKKNVMDQNFKNITIKGNVIKKDIMEDWINFALSFIDAKKIRPLKIAVDAGNGMAGLVIPFLEKKLPQIEIVPMYFELDGTFPNHLASPIEPENTEDLRKMVLEKNLDMGLAFDGDADRVFFIDDLGKVISGTVTTAMIAEMTLDKNKGATILYNAICGLVVPEIIEKKNGVGIKTRVGHSLIKADMKRTGAVFAGEHSGHYYFKENFNADSALIATLIVLEMVSNKNIKISELHKEYSKYFASGEVNSKVDDIAKKINELKSIYHDANKVDNLDGLSFYYNDYWFNIRPSNTEPYLRLNVEAKTQPLLKKITEKVLSDIRA